MRRNLHLLIGAAVLTLGNAAIGSLAFSNPAVFALVCVWAPVSGCAYGMFMTHAWRASK